jgi:hypothetical protein
MVRAFFPGFWTYYSLGIGNAGSTLLSNNGSTDSRQHEQVVGHDRTAHIRNESVPAGPGAAGEPEDALENRDVGFDPGMEVLELLVYPTALDHIQHRESLALGEGNITDPLCFGLAEVLPGCEFAIGGHLPWGRLKNCCWRSIRAGT